jgi:hypothetical protein
MNLEAMMSLEGMLVVALVIAAVGTAIAHVFRNASSPYLITITGTRMELIVSSGMMWTGAVALGVAALVAVSAVASPMIALAVFFGVEAVALDICAHRTRYVRIASPVVQHARVRVTSPFST